MTQTARDIVASAIADLHKIVDHARADGSVERMMHALERWKRRTVQDIRSSISPLEASKFSKIALRPNWVTAESADAPLVRHITFLETLLQEIEDRPGRTISVSASGPPPELPGKPVVFLGHAAADAALAEYLEAAITASVPDCDVFRTTRIGQIPSGIPWFQHVTSRLAGASRYVVLLTPISQTRPWVSFETGAAWMTGRTLVPALGGGPFSRRNRRTAEKPPAPFP